MLFPKSLVIATALAVQDLGHAVDQAGTKIAREHPRDFNTPFRPSELTVPVQEFPRSLDYGKSPIRRIVDPFLPGHGSPIPTHDF